jgi:hypothetical protein
VKRAGFFGAEIVKGRRVALREKRDTQKQGGEKEKENRGENRGKSMHIHLGNNFVLTGTYKDVCNTFEVAEDDLEVYRYAA